MRQETQETWFYPWVGKIPWRRKWQPTPVFLPRKSHRRGAWRATVHGGLKESDPTGHAHAHTHTHTSSWKKYHGEFS